MKNLIIIFLLLMLSGCGFVFQNFDEKENSKLSYGMSKEELVSKIGNPQKISKMVIDNKEYDVWEYPNNDKSKIEKMNALGIIYSKVFFLDNKLVQRDKNRVYAQPAYEYLESIDPEGGIESAKKSEKVNNPK